MRETLSQ